jgi:D-2-hydroxyacid dehydrogenase (NADP+)
MKIWIQDAYRADLEAAFPEHTFVNEWQEDIEAAMCPYPMLTRERLDALPRLRWAQILSAGYEKLDVDDVLRRGIQLTNARDVYSIPIAEHVLAMLLMLCRRFPAYGAAQRGHNWERDKGEIELYGRTALVLGTGSIGQEVGKRLQAMGMMTLGYRRKAAPAPGFDEVVSAAPGILEGLLARADAVVVTVDLNAQTRHLLGAAQFAAMKPGALLINIARGGVIDEAALTHALAQGAVGGVGLDVFEQEPLPEDSPLWDMEGAILTPHSAGTGDGVHGRMVALLCENLRRFQAGQTLLNAIQG